MDAARPSPSPETEPPPAALTDPPAAPPQPSPIAEGAAPRGGRSWKGGAGLVAIGVVLGFAAGLRVGSEYERTAHPVPLLGDAAPARPSSVPVLTAPIRGPALVNVWLQGCADCMPKFNAWSALVGAGRLPRGLAVHNVAYGDATHEYAARYHVDAALASDPGDVYVRPLGIGTFTTLLVDREGRVLERLDPTDRGFGDRVARFAEENPPRR